MSAPDSLPELPASAGNFYPDALSNAWVPGFTADQMRAYALAAVMAEREACAKVCDAFDWPGRRHTDYIQGQNDAFDKCAQAIRSRTKDTQS